MRPTIRTKLVLFGLLIVVVVSFGFTLLHLRLSRAWVEEDLRERAIAFAREVAATIGDQRELESGPLLERQIGQIRAVRQNVLQLDVLAFGAHDTRLIATSDPRTRLPFTRKDAENVRRGQVTSRLVQPDTTRSWEVIAPVVLDGTVAGAIAAKFSLDRADALAARVGAGALVMTAASVVVMGILMSVAVHFVVDRPVRRLTDAVGRVQQGRQWAPVAIASSDEFGVLARHFNDMMERLHSFSEELQTRVKDATGELEQRYREVERLNELLFAMQRSLSHAERLALSGRIMAEVAHEVGTPLHSVAGHVELLRRDLPAALLSEGITRRLDIIDVQLARVTEIITQLLDLTRRPTGEPTAVELNGLVRDTVELVRPGIARAKLALRVALDAAHPHVHGHHGQLQQVVLNLLTNAMDATPAGGRITVTTREIADGGEVEVEVADTGRGIPDMDHKRIFEPFFSTKEAGHGSGLGLFISAQIVREHKGRIELASEEGRGSTFRVRLPAPREGA